MTRLPLRMVALATVLALGLLVAACGDDDAATTTAAPTLDLVDTAIDAGQFETLVAAVQAADLVETLKGEGPFTVFAPTDDAFAALPEGTVESLLGDVPALTDVLLSHVVPGRVLAEDVAGLTTATTAGGNDVEIAVDGGTVTVGGATVVTTDILATNGVIHVIDAVILP